MKITKSMYYKEDENSRELMLFTVNESLLYSRCITPAIKNLHRKFLKGTFDVDKAVEMFYYVATDAAKEYNKIFLASDYTFSVTTRWTTAKNLLDYYMQDITEEE